MNYDESVRAIIAYCKENIDNFVAYADLAVDKVWKERCPIEMADYNLASKIVDCIEEWQIDNETDFDITVQDIILNM